MNVEALIWFALMVVFLLIESATVTMLSIWFVAGALAMTLSYLYPIDPEAISDNIITSIRLVIEPWKHYLMIPVACCAIALGLLALTRRRGFSRF